MSDHATALPDETINGNDLLRGIKAIAAFTGEDERRTHYLLEKRYIPAGQIGRLWVASKRTLRQHYERVVSGRAV